MQVVGNLAEAAVNPTVCVTNKDVKYCWSQYRLLRDTTHCYSPLGYLTIDCSYLSAIIQTIPHPPGGPSFKSISSPFTDKDVMKDCQMFCTGSGG